MNSGLVQLVDEDLRSSPQSRFSVRKRMIGDKISLRPMNFTRVGSKAEPRRRRASTAGTMSSTRLPNIPSLRKHQLLLELSVLVYPCAKSAC